MEKLKTDDLYEYLRRAAGEGRHITVHEVAQHFGVEVGTVRKRFSLLTGNLVLNEREKGKFDCAGVLRCSKEVFASAGSQGKGNQAYIRGLLREIEGLKHSRLAHSGR